MSGTQINLESLDELVAYAEARSKDTQISVEWQTVAALVDAVKAARVYIEAKPPINFGIRFFSQEEIAFRAALEPFSTAEKTQQTTTVETAEPSVMEVNRDRS